MRHALQRALPIRRIIYRIEVHRLSRGARGPHRRRRRRRRWRLCTARRLRPVRLSPCSSPATAVTSVVAEWRCLYFVVQRTLPCSQVARRGLCFMARASKRRSESEVTDVIFRRAVVVFRRGLLVADPRYRGGGVHGALPRESLERLRRLRHLWSFRCPTSLRATRICRLAAGTLSGGRLGVHADLNRHADTRLWRRVNLFVYLNRPPWPDE